MRRGGSPALHTVSLTRADFLQPAFLEGMIQRRAPGSDWRVLHVAPVPLDSSASILVTLTAGQSEQPIGLFGLTLTYTVDDEAPRTVRLVLKVKPPGSTVSAMLAGLAGMCGGQLAAVYPRFTARTGFEHTHWRELAVYDAFAPGPEGTVTPDAGSALLPRVWGLHSDPAAGQFAILMEYLEGAAAHLLNSVMAPEAWTDATLRAALDQLARWHARHLNQPLALRPEEAADQPSGAYMQELAPLWEALVANAADHFPTLYPPARVRALTGFIADIPLYWRELAARPKTLIHNDLNPRNTCFRAGGGSLQLCAYDWELATHHVPVYDAVELLCFVLDVPRYAQRLVYLEYYRQALHTYTGGEYADATAFRREAHLAARDFGLHRLGMYLMAHTVGPYPFLPRVVNSFFDTLVLTRE